MCAYFNQTNIFDIKSLGSREAKVDLIKYACQTSLTFLTVFQFLFEPTTQNGRRFQEELLKNATTAIPSPKIHRCVLKDLEENNEKGRHTEGEEL